MVSAVYQLPPQWKVVWVTGASSGIGREIALRLAASGVTVAASARSVDKLAELASASPSIKVYPLDVVDLEATKVVAAEIERDLGPIDLAILNAGVWNFMGATTYDAQVVNQSLAVNYTGVTNALAPLLPAMIARKSGHIAIVSSVAGYRGLPIAVAYAPTKAALINLAESLYPELADLGVKVSVINPGFVESPMTKDNKFPMPFIISTEEAVDTIIKGLIKGRFEIVFPWRMKWLATICRMLPNSWYFAFVRSLPDEAPEHRTK